MDGYKWKDIFTVGLPGFYFCILGSLLYAFICDISLIRCVEFVLSKDLNLSDSLAPMVFILVGCIINYWSGALEKICFSYCLNGKYNPANGILNNRSEHHLSYVSLRKLQEVAHASPSGYFCNEQVRSAMHYVSEEIGRSDKLDEYYVRKIMTRNLFLIHLLFFISISIVSIVFLFVSKCNCCIYIYSNLTIILLWSYNLLNSIIFRKLWYRFSKRYIQMQLAEYDKMTR